MTKIWPKIAAKSQKSPKSQKKPKIVIKWGRNSKNFVKKVKNWPKICKKIIEKWENHLPDKRFNLLERRQMWFDLTENNYRKRKINFGLTSDVTCDTRTAEAFGFFQFHFLKIFQVLKKEEWNLLDARLSVWWLLFHQLIFRELQILSINSFLVL